MNIRNSPAFSNVFGTCWCPLVMTASRLDTVSYLNLQVAKRCCEIGNRDAIFKPCKKKMCSFPGCFSLPWSLWAGKMKDSGNELVKTGEGCEENGCKGAAYIACNAVECHLLARHVSVSYLEEMFCICRISISFWAFSWTLLPEVKYVWRLRQTANSRQLRVTKAWKPVSLFWQVTR